MNKYTFVTELDGSFTIYRNNMTIAASKNGNLMKLIWDLLNGVI